MSTKKIKVSELKKGRSDFAENDESAEDMTRPASQERDYISIAKFKKICNEHFAGLSNNLDPKLKRKIKKPELRFVPGNKEIKLSVIISGLDDMVSAVAHWSYICKILNLIDEVKRHKKGQPKTVAVVFANKSDILQFKSYYQGLAERAGVKMKITNKELAHGINLFCGGLITPYGYLLPASEQKIKNIFHRNPKISQYQKDIKCSLDSTYASSTHLLATALVGG